MKKTLSMITLAAFALMLLGSCTKINERLDSLEKKVDGLENEEIATIESQVQSIESSIIDLKSIRDKVQAMSDPATGLSKRIKDLESFVSDVKKDYATKDWAKTTLVTMAEYEKTCDTVAKIALRVEGFDSSLNACAESLKGWVNGKFGGYYDIATIDAKLAELWAQVDGVDSLRAELAKTREEIDTAKSAIRAEYRAAITSAIETSEGKLTQALQDSIDSVNATIGTLTGRVDNLETKVEALKGKVDSLENMIQSVTIVPAFSDGSVILEDDILLYVDFIVSPAGAVDSLKKEDINILLNNVENTSLKLDTIPNGKIRSFVKDRTSGAVSLKIAVPEYVPEPKQSLSIAVNVNDGFSDNTTEFVNTTFVIGYVEIAAKYDGETVTTRKWAKQNISISKSGRREFLQTGHFNGDYFQWAASYEGYNVEEANRKPDALLLYTDFSSQCCGDNEDKFTFKGDKSFNDINVAPYYSVSTYSKYNSEDNIIELDETDDVASIILGEGWRMPTKTEFQAMKDTTYWAWDATDKGYYVYAPQSGDAGKINNGKVSDYTYNKSDALLFFPAVGAGGDGFNTVGSSCGYRMSTRYDLSEEYHLFFTSFTVNLNVRAVRYFGFSIRPVAD